MKENEAIKAALKLLSIRPRSAAELGSRLGSKGFAAGEIEKAICELSGAGWIDDERFARALADSRVRNKGWGPGRIRADLASKGVNEDIIRSVLRGLDEASQEGPASHSLGKWMKKRGLKPPLGGKERASAHRFLRARGFSGHVISKVLKGDGE